MWNGNLLNNNNGNNDNVKICQQFNELLKFDNKNMKGNVFGVYLDSNEIRKEELFDFLNRKKIHIGCASLFNFDIVCSRKSDYCLIFDYNNNNNTYFLNIVINYVINSNTRELFVDKLQQFINIDYNQLSNQSSNRLFAWLDIKDINGYANFKIKLNDKNSWLSSDDNYNFIRNMCIDNKIISITNDITDSTSFKEIKKIITNCDISVDTLYLSNISDFMRSNVISVTKFIQTIDVLIDDTTIIICCPLTRNGQHLNLFYISSCQYMKNKNIVFDR
jgi:hypothetical protein